MAAHDEDSGDERGGAGHDAEQAQRLRRLRAADVQRALEADQPRQDALGPGEGRDEAALAQEPQGEATDVDEVTDEIRKLLNDMAETMYAAPGVGLAAPQIGVLKRIFVIDIAGDDEPSDLRNFINPEITKA